MGMVWVGYRRDPRTAEACLLDADRLEELLDSDDDDASVDLDKAWHGLHWLLTGSSGETAGVLSEAIFGGEPLGEDLGYGPGRLLPAAQVSLVADALKMLDIDTFRRRMDGRAMTNAEIYPSIWDENDVFDEYLVPAFTDLRRFYEQASTAGQAVIQTIC